VALGIVGQAPQKEGVAAPLPAHDVIPHIALAEFIFFAQSAAAVRRRKTPTDQDRVRQVGAHL
jgi:hypothetical protein